MRTFVIALKMPKVSKFEENYLGRYFVTIVTVTLC